MAAGAKNLRRSLVFIGLFFVFSGALSAQAASSSAVYTRIASVTLMGDEFLSLVADPRQIAAYSRFADDPVLSNIQGSASLVSGRAWLNLEVLWKLKPDLVVAADWSDSSQLAFLKEKGIPVFVIKTPRTWADVRARTAELAAFIGRTKAGAEVLGRLDAREAALTARAAGLSRRKTLLEYGAFGTSMGRGTLWNDVCRLAGVDNLAARLQADAYGYAPLSKEVLVKLDPDLLVLPDEASLQSYRRASFTADLQADPLFRSLRAVKSGSLIFFSEALRTTASPFALDSAEKLFHAAYPDLR